MSDESLCSPARIRRRVLVVDDHADSAEIASVHLEARGHQTRTASNSEVALSVALEFRPTTAVIDIGAGEESGYALARRLMMLPGLASIRLIAATGYPSRDVEAEGDAVGVRFFRCLTKPISPSALFAAVENEIPGELATKDR